MKERICLIGYGYWGKILHKNLSNMSFSEVKVIDEVLGNMHELDESYDYYFIATPFTTHMEIIDILSKFRGKKIWCEKPLAPTYNEVSRAYKKLGARDNKLFVDWVYTHNPAIEYLADALSGKRIKQVILNRTNDGPVRSDCNSIWDLSSHDISILIKVLGDQRYEFNWNEFSIKTHEDFGSNVSWLYLNGTQIIINSSWQHQKKNRVSVFITDDDEIIVFDDIRKTVTLSSGEIKDFSLDKSPLEAAIDYFINSEDFSENRSITESITLAINGYNQGTNKNGKN